MNDRLVSARSVWADYKLNRHTKSFNVNRESHGSLRGKTPFLRSKAHGLIVPVVYIKTEEAGRNNLSCERDLVVVLWIHLFTSIFRWTQTDTHTHTHPALRHRTQTACNSSALIFAVRLGNYSSNSTNQWGNESRASLGLLPSSFPMWIKWSKILVFLASVCLVQWSPP